MPPSQSTIDRDAALIRQITVRAIMRCRIKGIVRKQVDIAQQLALVHARQPLDLAALLAAQEPDFDYDIFGIAENFDGQTCLLKTGFTPRFAVAA